MLRYRAVIASGYLYDVAVGTKRTVLAPCAWQLLALLSSLSVLIVARSDGAGDQRFEQNRVRGDCRHLPGWARCPARSVSRSRALRQE